MKPDMKKVKKWATEMTQLEQFVMQKIGKMAIIPGTDGKINAGEFKILIKAFKSGFEITAKSIDDLIEREGVPYTREQVEAMYER